MMHKVSKDLKQVIVELEQGFIPSELRYGLDQNAMVKFEWSSLMYNDYNRVDYWFDKLPDGLLDQFPCLESYYLEWAEECTKKTPLQELEERSCLLELINLENLKI
jgi:hypothetical protein